MLQLLTSKPALYVCNVDEASAERRQRPVGPWSPSGPARGRGQGGGDLGQDRERDRPAGPGRAGRVPGDPRAWPSPASNRLIREAYALLGLQTYFTAGPKEARAWTIPVGATAPQAAGVIHTDFEKGFIRAETIAYEDYVRLNGEAGAREAGKLRPKARNMSSRTAT